MRAPFNDVVAFVTAQRGRLAPWLRLPLLVATLAFGCSGWLRARTLFHRQSPDLRAGQVEAWRNSRFAACRDLIRFYESLSLLALYGRPEFSAPRPDRVA